MEQQKENDEYLLLQGQRHQVKSKLLSCSF